MQTSRLDNVLRRNRRSTILDVVLVAFIVVGVLFTGLAFGQELPKLTSAPVAAGSAADAPAATVGDTGVAQPAAPVRLARR
jgi:hypothetical protein